MSKRKRKTSKYHFGNLKDGREAHIYRLTNSNGLEAEITNFGGILVSLKVPDANQDIDDIVLGYDTLDEYVADTNYFGCTVGRYANRIAGGNFRIDDIEYQLTQNDGENHLHGGLFGFNKKLWDAYSKGDTIGLRYSSRDGEEGYPGNLTATVRYILTDRDELKIEYTATTDKPTLCNLSHHSYFNLAGAGNTDITRHNLTINARRFTPIQEDLVPTGEFQKVIGTPLDFTHPTEIGARIDEDHIQLRLGGGYDHNWTLNSSEQSDPAATVYEPNTGRVMELYTTEPGLQFYSGNFLDRKTKGKKRKRYPHRGGLCLEAQHYPNSPNQPTFPSTVLKPRETYRQTTTYKFSMRPSPVLPSIGKT
jgi:aldose 1-epimerase